jgi:hypothetical protein
MPGNLFAGVTLLQLDLQGEYGNNVNGKRYLVLAVAENVAGMVV